MCRLHHRGHCGDHGAAASTHQGATCGCGAHGAGHTVGHAVVPDVGGHGECVCGGCLGLEAWNDLLYVSVRVPDQGCDEVVCLAGRLR